MRSTFKVLFYVNGSKEKEGIVPIMGRITINGSVAQFSCKQTVSTALWDAKANKAKGKSSDAQKVNYALENIKAQIIKHYQKISDKEAYVSADMIRNAFQGIGNEYETLLRAFDKDNADFHKRVGKDRSAGTYLKLTIVRNHLAEFIKSHYKRSDMSMNELTEDFIRDFSVYLGTELGLAQSTVWMYCVPLKRIVTRAHYNGHISKNPFIQYHISPNIKEREYLTEPELKMIMNHKFADPTLTQMRDIFVFGCLTGISFIDIKQLTTDQIAIINDSQWIVSRRQKTKTPFQVKLLETPLQIIQRYEPFRNGKYLFNLCGNSRANVKLKQIAKECGLEKKLTFHMSRHTFGTLALSKGMPIESVSKILGHTKITTTQIYAKITADKLDKDISLFEDKLGKKFKIG